MIERVARRLNGAFLRGYGTGQFTDEHSDDWLWERAAPEATRANWLRLARAAIAAMREPEDWRIDTPEGNAIMARRQGAYTEACRQTDCMNRGFNETDTGKCAACADLADFVIEAYWRALIDEALEGRVSA